MATEVEAVTKAATAEEPEKVVTEKPKASKEKKPKAPKEKKKPKQSKSLSHPPYFQMITEALTAQQEKSGSSPYAIGKYMEEQHKDELPPNFRKILAVQLKHFAAKGKLIKIKASYKLAEAAKPRTSTTTTTAVKKTRSVTKIKAEGAVAVPKPKKAKKSTAAKPKQPKSIKSSAAKKTKKVTA